VERDEPRTLAKYDDASAVALFDKLQEAWVTARVKGLYRTFADTCPAPSVSPAELGRSGVPSRLTPAW